MKHGLTLEPVDVSINASFSPITKENNVDGLRFLRNYSALDRFGVGFRLNHNKLVDYLVSNCGISSNMSSLA